MDDDRDYCFHSMTVPDCNSCLHSKIHRMDHHIERLRQMLVDAGAGQALALHDALWFGGNAVPPPDRTPEDLLICMDCGESKPMYPMFLSDLDGAVGTICLDCEQAWRDLLSPGDYIVVHWTEGDEQQIAAGYFDHYEEVFIGDVLLLVLDWGCGIMTTADNFRWERSISPAVYAYVPINRV